MSDKLKKLKELANLVDKCETFIDRAEYFKNVMHDEQFEVEYLVDVSVRARSTSGTQTVNINMSEGLLFPKKLLGEMVNFIIQGQRSRVEKVLDHLYKGISFGENFGKEVEDESIKRAN